MDRNPNTFRNRLVGVAMATVMAFGVIAGVAAGDAGAQVSSKYDASIDSTIADIQAFWTSTMPTVYGQQYEAIPTDRVYPYSQDNPPPNCEDGGQTKAPYEQVAGNAFYCSNGDFVAYDEQGLLPKLRDNFGEFAVGLVFAHELGHAVQARVGYNPPSTVYYEQQADCFAGAWAQHVADSNDSNVHLARSDLDTALAGLLTLSDPSGIDGSQDGAHGNGFDRVSAFQDGYEGGAQACADYQNNPPVVTETGYTSSQDQATGGNLPLDEMTADGHPEPRPVLGLAVVEAHRPDRDRRGRRRRRTARDGGVLTDGVVVRPVDQHRALRRGDAAERARLDRRLRRRTAPGDRVGVVGRAPAGRATRHRHRPPRRRVPGRRLGRRHVVVAVARRPRRSGHRAGVGRAGQRRPGHRVRPGGRVP